MDKVPRKRTTLGELPFFPKFDSMLICQDKLRINWFEVDFCQSRFSSDKSNGSNSCTIIAILVASYCCKNNIPMNGPSKESSYFLIETIGKAILDGNRIHKSARKRGILKDEYVTIPEAIKFAAKSVKGIREWKSMVYMKPLQTSLEPNLKLHLEEWKNSSHSKRRPDLYVVLICDSRSVVFIVDYEMDSVTLIDTHQHSHSKGAVLAVVRKKYLKCLCTYLCYINSKYYNSLPIIYELSFLYFRKE